MAQVAIFFNKALNLTSNVDKGQKLYKELILLVIKLFLSNFIPKRNG